jgi:serine/threonine-protein kinase
VTPSGGGISGSGGGAFESAIPEYIDRYRVVRMIGKGGQGDVFLAHDPNLDIEVAIKVLHAEFRTEEFMERFTLDARILARLSAPNIVRIFDFNPGYPYLVMEYCGDGDLNRLIKCRRPLALPKIVALVRQICDALTAAHERDDPILHRDLKPANVLFQQGVPKVADFGLAKVLSGASSGLTTTRGMMGTVGYASPEQLKDASRVDHRTDLWAVGIILYELLTFRAPFERPGDDFVNVAIKVRTEPPADPPYPVPEPLWAVVQRGLAKEPEERYRSAREMAQALDQALALIPEANQITLPPGDVLGEVDVMASRVADSLDSGSTDHARTLLEQMRQISPDDSLVRYWQRRLKEVSEDRKPSDASSQSEQETKVISGQYGVIENLIDQSDYVGARRECGKVLIERPDDVSVQRLLQRIIEDESRRTRRLEEIRRDVEKARAAQDFRQVVELWSKAAQDFPNDPDIRAEVAVATSELEMVTRREHRQRAEREARRFEESGELATAATVWEEYLAEHPKDTEAAARRDAIRERLAAKSQEERRLALIGEAGQLEGEGRLEAALAVLEGWLRETPGDEEVVRRAEDLRVRVADLKLASILETTREEAEGCLARDDIEGALSVWRRLLEDHPTHPDVRREVEQLEYRLEGSRKAALGQEVQRAAERLDSRLKTRRYESLDEVGPVVERALLVARQNLDGGLPALTTAKQALIEAESTGEARLREVLDETRASLRDRIGETSELLEAREGDAGTGAEEALLRAWDEAVEALGEASAPDSSGDLVARLQGAGDALDRCLQTLEAERRETTEAARVRAEEGLRLAEAALDALRSLPDLSGAPTNLSELGARLEELRGQLASRSATRLAAAAEAAAVLAAEADTGRVAALWHAQDQLRGLIDEALEVAPGDSGQKLATLLQSAAGILDPAEGEAMVPADVVTARDGLRTEIPSCRQRLKERTGRARKQWSRVADAAPPPIHAERFEEIKKTGAAALAASRFEEVERYASTLESLGRRGWIESIWADHRSAVGAVEGPADDDGVVAGPADPEAQERLARYREAFAGGEIEKLRASSGELDRTSGRAEAEEVVDVPELSRRARKFNERYRSEALERYDREIEAYDEAHARGERMDAARSASAAARHHEVLLQPPSRLRWAIPAVGAVVVLGLAPFVVDGGGSRGAQVTLFSPTGPIEIRNVTKGGDAWPLQASERTVTEGGVEWTLEPGDYVVETEGGVEIPFRVPRDRSVLIPGPSTDYEAELIEVLGIDELMEPGQP